MTPGGLVTSFVDAIGPRRGGAEAPTVKIRFGGSTSTIDLTYGDGGLDGYGDNLANVAAHPIGQP